MRNEDNGTSDRAYPPLLTGKKKNTDIDLHTVPVICELIVELI